MKPLCIYHGHCDDGFAAAWAVRHALGEVEFYAGIYQQDPPDVTDRNVILVDFSYKRPVLMEMASKARSLLILDHHATAVEDLKDVMAPEHHGVASSFGKPDATRYEALCACIFQMGDEVPRMRALFDMKRSGAGLAWDFFHPDERRPDFINYIEDRDLWTKALPGSDEFTIALRSYTQSFEVWDNFVLASNGVSFLKQQGEAIQRYYRLRVEELKRSAYTAWITLPGTHGPAPADLGLRVQCAVANAPYFAASEVAGELCDVPGACFGASYFEVRPGEWQYSLRSRGDFDVSSLARCFGGGGHKNAAGFTAKSIVHERALG